MHLRFLPLLLLAACGGAAQPAMDAGWDSSPPRDTRLPADTVPPVPTVEFTVANCPSMDLQKKNCTGTAPFTVQFMPIISSGITNVQWTFGDGAPDTTWTPSHTYTSPGSYDVTLRSVVPSGVLEQTHKGFIVVLPNAEGAPCTRDQQCSSKICLCSAANPCGYGPVNGLCSSLCQRTSCPDGQACVNLATSASNTRLEPWQSQVCLPACDDDQDCSAGLRCRSLPGWPNTASRVKACFVDVPGEMGSSCVDSANRLRDDLCLSGLCADLGALGMCSRDCSIEPCLAGSDCAVFANGRSLCLPTCSAKVPCHADPLLECVDPNTSQVDFWIQSSGNSGGGAYCAPKSCVANPECGAGGICLQSSGSGHCVSRYR